MFFFAVFFIRNKKYEYLRNKEYFNMTRLILNTFQERKKNTVFLDFFVVGRLKPNIYLSEKD